MPPEDTTGASGAAATAAAAAGGGGADTFVAHMSIPTASVGSIIGKGGAHILQIRALSGARVKVHDHVTGQPSRLVEFRGSPDQVSQAQLLVQGYLMMGGATGGGGAPAAPSGAAAAAAAAQAAVVAVAQQQQPQHMPGMMLVMSPQGMPMLVPVMGAGYPAFGYPGPGGFPMASFVPTAWMPQPPQEPRHSR
jgi:hypothetical protein